MGHIRGMKMGKVYTYRDLLNRLDDLKALAVPPADEEIGGAFCNYNRDCRYDPETDTYQNWSQKGDGSLYCERVENGEFVLMDQAGPGVIWRFWTCLQTDENPPIRIYIDGQPDPVVDMTVPEFFKVNGDDFPSTNYPNLISTERSRGWLSYLPIPFHRHIKITTSHLFMHQFTFTLFPKDTVLPDFRDRFSVENNIARAEADRRLGERDQPDGSLAWTEVSTDAAAGEETVLFETAGPGAIYGLRLYPSFPAGCDKAELLRKLVLKIYWDGREAPAVWTPLGDFFGAAMGIHPYRTVPNGMHRLEFYSNWYMPYGDGARIVVENRSEMDCPLHLELHTEPLDREPDTLLRFHAKWHPEEFLKVDPTRFREGGDRHPDWPVLLTEGRGRFCGLSLHVYNNWWDPIVPADTWWYGKWHPTLPYHVSIDWFWGEGREKVFVDGSKTPSIFGTGCEDYIGYAFSAEPPFVRWDSPFAAVPQVPLTGKGHTSHCRYQIADNVPFHRDFQFWVEKYKPDLWRNVLNPEEHGDAQNCTYFDVICYWYLEAGKDDDYPGYSTEELWDRYHLPGEPEKR